MKKILMWKSYAVSMLIPSLGFCLIIFPVLQATAQGKRAVFGEVVTCNVKVRTELNQVNRQKANGNITTPAKKEEEYKSYQPQLNQLGHFDRISNIQPLQTVPVEMAYPDGKEGEKVLIMVWDGGTLDNDKKASVAVLNSQKKISFNFQVSKYAGLYRVILRKGTDTKVVQLWVGAEPTPSKLTVK